MSTGSILDISVILPYMSNGSILDISVILPVYVTFHTKTYLLILLLNVTHRYNELDTPIVNDNKLKYFHTTSRDKHYCYSFNVVSI